MRVGLATAKGLAFGLDVPIVGVGTAEALAAAAWQAREKIIVVLQPAGPGGRYVTVLRSEGAARATVVDGPAFVAAADDVAIPAGARTLAVDVDGAPPAAAAAGEAALARLPETLVRLGRERLASTGPDDLAVLVPAYVTLPRGAAAPMEGIAWSPARP
jgi:tRNA threonylcarbamoyladenosine biosynthesis protein TsaB